MSYGPSRRRRAAEMFSAGVHRAEVARRVGISRSTSSVWHRRWAEGTLLAERRGGRPPRLDAAQRARIGRALLEPPGAHGIPAPSWSLRAVALLIERQTGVRHHHRHVARLVTRAGWLAPPFACHAEAARFVQPIETPAGPLNLLVGVGPPTRSN